MIAGPYVKAALAEKLDGTQGFCHVTTDREWEPKLFLFLDGSLIESTTDFDFDGGDYCGKKLRELQEVSRFFLYACSIADDDEPSSFDVEIQVSKFVSAVLATVAEDISLGVEVSGVRSVRAAVVSNETSTRQMQAGAGGQLFNACRAVLEIEVSAYLAPASLATT